MAQKKWTSTKAIFNTSGMKYRELELKDKLPTMTEEEQYQLLATDGMLVKRPLLLGEEFCKFQDLRRMSGRKPVHWRSRK